jgi:hypothetical protein
MRLTKLGLAFAGGPALLLFLPAAKAQEFVIPEDGMFYIEQRPAFTFEATLADDWINTERHRGELRVFAPLPPQLPSQDIRSSGLSAPAKNKKARKLLEDVGKRPMLALSVKTYGRSKEEKIDLRFESRGTLYARTMKLGAPPTPAPRLSGLERREYLRTAPTMDHDNSDFRRWLGEQGLERGKDEQAMHFGHRVFMHLVKNGTYGGDTSSYGSRRPSGVAPSMANDCGGLSLLFVGIMRANNVPARSLFGRWAIQQTDAYPQWHVMAEFYVEKSGWVPVDIAGTIVHKPADPNALFGNSDGQFLTFHVDTDLQPAEGFRHGWAQYLLLQWLGPGQFGYHSVWNVKRSPAG